MSAKPRKRKTGRPAKITLAAVRAVGHLIALGMTEEQACLAEALNHGSFRSAVHRKPTFATAIKSEHAQFLRRALTAIADGGEVSTLGGGSRAPWTGLAWILERRHKPQFNRTEAAVLAIAAGGAVLTPEQMVELERLAKQMFTTKTP